MTELEKLGSRPAGKPVALVADDRQGEQPTDIVAAIDTQWTTEFFPAYFRELKHRRELNRGRAQHRALRVWHRRLLSGALAEDPHRPETWVVDELWHEACREAADVLL